MNKIIIVLVFFNIFYFKTATAQDDLKNPEAQATINDTRSFNILSLNGKNVKVSIIPDYKNRVLSLTCFKDTIKISDFWGVPPKVSMLNKNFIEIKYEVRGGSNLGLGNILVVCANGNNLYEALHILRYSNWDSGDLKTNYNISLTLAGNNKNNYKITLHVHDKVDSKHDPKINYSYNNQSILNFDIRQNVFYSIKENAYDQFVYTDATKTKKQNVGGNFPVIISGKENYYFINNKWYQLGRSKEMHEFQ